MCQHLEVVKRDRDWGCSRQVVLQDLKVEIQLALARWSKLLPYHVVIVDDSVIHEGRSHEVVPSKLTPNPSSNRQ